MGYQERREAERRFQEREDKQIPGTHDNVDLDRDWATMRRDSEVHERDLPIVYPEDSASNVSSVPSYRPQRRAATTRSREPRRRSRSRSRSPERYEESEISERRPRRTTRSYAASEESSVLSRDNDRRRLADDSQVSRREDGSFVTLRTRFDRPQMQKTLRRDESNVTHHAEERHETRAGAPLRRHEPIYDDASMTSADTYDRGHTGRTAERVDFRKGGYAHSDVSEESRVDRFARRSYPASVASSDQASILSRDDDGFRPYSRARNRSPQSGRYGGRQTTRSTESVVTESVVTRRRRSPRSRSPAETESVVPRRRTRSRSVSPVDTESVVPRRQTRSRSPADTESVVPRRQNRSRSPAETESVVPRRKPRSRSPAETESVVPRRRTRSRSVSPVDTESVVPRRRTRSRSRSPADTESVVPRRRRDVSPSRSMASTASYAYTEESSVAPAPRRLRPASAYAGSVLSNYTDEPRGGMRTIRYAPSTGRDSYLHVRNPGIVATPLNRQGSLGDVGQDSIVSDRTDRTPLADEYTPRTPAGRVDDRQHERPSRAPSMAGSDIRSVYSRPQFQHAPSESSERSVFTGRPESETFGPARSIGGRSESVSSYSRPPLLNHRAQHAPSEASQRSMFSHAPPLLNQRQGEPSPNPSVTESAYSRSDDREVYRGAEERGGRPNDEDRRPNLYIRGPTAGRLSPVHREIHQQQDDKQSVYSRGRPRLMARGSHARSRSLDSFRQALSVIGSQISRNSEGTIAADAFRRSNFTPARSTHGQDHGQDDDDENLGVPPSNASVQESVYSRRQRHAMAGTPAASRVGRSRQRDGRREQRSRSVDSRIVPLDANNLMMHDRMSQRDSPSQMGPAGPPSEITIHLAIPNKANGGAQAASVMSVQQRHPDGSVTDVVSAAPSVGGQSQRLAEMRERYQGAKSPAASMASRGAGRPVMRRPLPNGKGAPQPRGKGAARVHGAPSPFRVSVSQREAQPEEDGDHESVGHASTAYQSSSDRQAPSQAASQAQTALSKSEQFVLCPKRIHKLRQGLRAQLVQEDTDYEVCWRCDHCNLYVEGPDFVLNPWHCECGYDLCNRCYEYFLVEEGGQTRASNAKHEHEAEDADRKRRILQWEPKVAQ